VIRAIASPGDIPLPGQPSVTGEFFMTPEGYFCALCWSQARLVRNIAECGLRCQNATCPQSQYLYEPVRCYLPRAKPRRAPGEE